MKLIYIKFLLIIFFISLFSGCSNRSEKTSKTADNKIYSTFQDNASAIVSIQTFDHYNRRLKTGYGFYINQNTILTQLNLIQGAYKAKVSPLGTTQEFDVMGYTSFDFDNNIVTLQTQRKVHNFVDLKQSIVDGDSIYSLSRDKGKLMARKYFFIKNDSIDNKFISHSREVGKPLFYYNHSFAGLFANYDKDSQIATMLDVVVLDSLTKKFLPYPEPVVDLNIKTNKEYTPYQKVAAIGFETEEGNFTIRLFNETPKYRDNFIKLVEDQFYDSLLVHRVLKSFLIQTGAADTRYATPEDVVGWQGPGYTLPMNVVKGKFHRRGAVAASKLPDERNPKNNSDGSQFYIVSGRIFTHQELDDIEKNKAIKFTSQQRTEYTTVGGAPHLDEDYTVFGEIISGMNVIDKISLVDTDKADRPLKDIRVKRAYIIEK